MTAEAAEDQDQSMEEILQSIKRIIADEDDDAPENNGSGSDVLELTEVVQDDGTVVDARNGGIDDDEPFNTRSEAAMMPMSEDKLVSDKTESASAAAFKALAEQNRPIPTPVPRIESPAFRSGNTLEDLMLEALRPMLKDWLDANLKQIVEHMVEKEVRRISGK